MVWRHAIVITEVLQCRNLKNSEGGAMKQFIVIEKNTGQIISSGTCQDDMLNAQITDDSKMVIEGCANDRLHEYVNGKIVKKSAKKVAAASPPKPPPIEKRKAKITNEAYDALLERVSALEKELYKMY